MCSEWLGMHFLGHSVVPAVVLLPGVNLYPSLSSLSSLPFALHCRARACLRWVCTWVASSLCGACARASVPLLVPCASASFFALAAFFLPFSCVFVWSFLLLCSVGLSSFSLSSLRLSRPRAALPWGFLGPLEYHILTYPTHDNATQNMTCHFD